MDEHAHTVRHLIDAGAAVVTLGSVFNTLPNIAAGLAVIWYLFRFVDWWRNRK